jgi:hypothetical protein
MKFEFKATSSFDDSKVIVLKIEEEGLTEVLEALADFLRGCGYQLDNGSLQIVEEEIESKINKIWKA